MTPLDKAALAVARSLFGLADDEFMTVQQVFDWKVLQALLREAKAQVWTSYADEIERCRDLARSVPGSFTIEVLNDLLQYGRAQSASCCYPATQSEDDAEARRQTEQDNYLG